MDGALMTPRCVRVDDAGFITQVSLSCVRVGGRRRERLPSAVLPTILSFNDYRYDFLHQMLSPTGVLISSGPVRGMVRTLVAVPLIKDTSAMDVLRVCGN